MIVSGSGLVIYLVLAILLMKPMAASGIALANSISYSIQAIILVVSLNRTLPERFRLGVTFLRSILSGLAGGVCAWLIFSVLPFPLPVLVLSLGGMLLGAIVAVVPILPEIRLLTKL